MPPPHPVPFDSAQDRPLPQGEREPVGESRPQTLPPHTLDRRHVYIFPTRQGWLFTLVLLLMLLGSINYNSSLGYALTFLLASLFLIGMLHTWRNLAGLRFAGGRAPAVFAGEEAVFSLSLDNRGGPPRYAVSLTAVPPRRRWPPTADAATGVTADLPGDRIGSLRLSVPAKHRGWLPLGRIEIRTAFPLGLFTAWSYWSPPLRCLVYPRPVGVLPLPALTPQTVKPEGGRHTGTDDFFGFRDYRPGDSPRHIAWKALAREQGLHVKRFAGGSGGELILRLQELAFLGSLEMQLSQLCKWVLEVHGQGLAYGLELPAVAIAPAIGEGHRDRCLAVLATHESHSRPS